MANNVVHFAIQADDVDLSPLLLRLGLRPSIRQHDVRAAVGELLRDDAADSFAAGDDDNPVLEIHVSSRLSDASGPARFHRE